MMIMLLLLLTYLLTYALHMINHHHSCVLHHPKEGMMIAVAV
jgi:hypothetical protein